MKTFSIQTLGCKVNQYESDQIAALLRARGLEQVPAADRADLRVVNTCSVTLQAASKSRQTIRRTTRTTSLPILNTAAHGVAPVSPVSASTRTVVTGCWATSNAAEASALPNVDAVITHHQDVAAELDRVLDRWLRESNSASNETTASASSGSPTESVRNDGWIIGRAPEAQSATLAGTQAGTPTEPLAGSHDRLARPPAVKGKLTAGAAIGTRALPLLTEHRTGHQRAFLKVQDGCDAHCTYCIIPQLRPSLWNKPIDDAVEEARRLVDAGHVEIVLTGIFLGAYGQPTALRRRQAVRGKPQIGSLIEALCTRVPGLRRLRLSSLEPGDLTDELIEILRAHQQVVPHFHLPLQSGSELLLRRMNRQYTRDEFFCMLDCVYIAFDRPALTTDIIVGFPGETDAEFAHTLEVVDRARFIHTHAFSYSPRPGTAAARWGDDFVHGSVVNERIAVLNERGEQHSLAFRRQFIGETVEVLVERIEDETSPARHGRCERYFDVEFDDASVSAGDCVAVGIDEVAGSSTRGHSR